MFGLFICQFIYLPKKRNFRMFFTVFVLTVLAAFSSIATSSWMLPIETPPIEHLSMEEQNPDAFYPFLARPKRYLSLAEFSNQIDDNSAGFLLIPDHTTTIGWQKRRPIQPSPLRKKRQNAKMSLPCSVPYPILRSATPKTVIALLRANEL